MATEIKTYMVQVYISVARQNLVEPNGDWTDQDRCSVINHFADKQYVRQGRFRLYSYFFLGLVGLMGVYIYVKAPKTPDALPKTTAEVPIEALERTLKDQVDNLINKPEAMLFREGNVIGVGAILRGDKEREKISLLETGIHLVTRKKVKWNPETSNQFFSLILNYVVENKKLFKGRKAKSLGLAMRLLGKIDQPNSRTKEYKDLVKLLEKTDPLPLYQLGLEVTTGWTPFPGAAEKALKIELGSKDPNRVYTSLQLIPTVVDTPARTRLCAALYETYPRLSENVRPMGLKVLATVHTLLPKPVDPLIRKAAAENSDSWIDATISAIELTESATSYRKELEGMMKRTANQILLQRIDTLLNGSPQGGA